MRTGLKILLHKIANQLKYPTPLYSDIDVHVFPEKPISRIKTEARLHALQSELKQGDISFNLGSLYSRPHNTAIDTYKKLIKYNPGNLGSWADDIAKTHSTTRLEYEVIHKLIDLYHGKHNDLTGYITSGATEGNIFSVWLGRTYLEKYCNHSNICLIRTSLTHYSIQKAGKICNVPEFLTPLNEQEWNMDRQGFIETVTNLYKGGYRGFIVPLTFGYTSTGTCDDAGTLTNTAETLKKQLKGITFYFWIDAALNGLIAPFITNSFSPFSSNKIQALVVDFHKFGLVPFTAGIVLYRKTLKKLIEQPINYLLETDATLSGSRSGIPAASIWMMIHTMGKSGYRHLVEKQRENKHFFIKNVRTLFPKIQVITHPHSLSCGLMFQNFKNNRLPQWIEEKYSLYPGKTKLLFYPKEVKEKIIYKFFFLPHVTKQSITYFLQNLAVIIDDSHVT